MRYIYVGKHLPSTQNSYKGLFERIRYMFLKGYIEECGKCVNIQPNATIDRRVKIGNYSGVGRNCIIAGGVKIGNHVMMGPEVYIYTQNHNFSRTDLPMDKLGWQQKRPVTIEDDVGIGARVTILPGVTICRGSVVGASAVVAKSCPPYSVIAGNLAIVVKSRI